MNIIGYFSGYDPAACLLSDGQLVAYVEEERLIRFKHAPGMFPIRAMRTCLEIGGISLQDVDRFVYGWDAPLYSSGGMATFYEQLNEQHPPDEATRAWQRGTVGTFKVDNLRSALVSELVRALGVGPESVPPLEFVSHHLAHASAAFLLSPYEEALVLTLDGSGDRDCTTVWRGKGSTLEQLHTTRIPHSLGWFYAALTEYLGFRAYNGEYKVMGLAAYGRESTGLREKLARVVRVGADGDYTLDPKYIHHGPHTWSSRFTDHLVDLLEVPPRIGDQELTPAHEDLAFETQRLLEETVLPLVRRFQQETGLTNLCIGGGVGLNVKLNSRIHRSDLFEGVFPFPIPGDSGTSIGAALGLHIREGGSRPEPLAHVYLGPSFSDEEIESQLQACHIPYRRCDDIAADTAELLAEGKVVGWFQGALEAGPRALGSRSIVADPRSAAGRDRVNAAIKFREYWRPFCPSLAREDASRFLQRSCDAPFMILAFEATAEAREQVPGVVHVDGTMRAQTVTADTNPRYHRLLKEFETRTGVPVVLNTSFNVKGEAIVCTPRDAFRTFWATGLDALAVGTFLVEKGR